MADTEFDGDNALDEYEKSFNEFSGIDQDEGDILRDEDDAQEDVSADGNEGEGEGETESIEALRQQLEAERNERLRLQQERDQLEHSFNSQRGRVSALQKKIDSETKPDTESVDYNENLKLLLEDYPELIKPVVDHFENKLNMVTGGVNEKLSYIEQIERQRYIDAQVAEMNAFMPEWGNVVASSGYTNWLAQQPKNVQNMAQSIDANDYKFLLSAYTSQTRGQAHDLIASRQKKLAANATIRSKGPSSRSSAPDDFDAAFQYYAAKK